MPLVACGNSPGKRVPARIRALEGGREVLNWVCVRWIRPHVVCVLVGTIPVERGIRVGRAGGRCLAAMAQTRGSLVVKLGTVCHLRAPIVHGSRKASHGQDLIGFGLNPYVCRYSPESV